VRQGEAATAANTRETALAPPSPGAFKGKISGNKGRGKPRKEAAAGDATPLLTAGCEDIACKGAARSGRRQRKNPLRAKARGSGTADCGECGEKCCPDRTTLPRANFEKKPEDRPARIRGKDLKTRTAKEMTVWAEKPNYQQKKGRATCSLGTVSGVQVRGNLERRLRYPKRALQAGRGTPHSSVVSRERKKLSSKGRIRRFLRVSP